MQNLQRQFAGQMDEATLQAQLSRVHEEGRPAAERSVREALLLDAVARAHELEVADDELAARFAELAEAQGVPTETFQQFAEQQGWGASIRAELLDQKAIDFLAAKAKVKETADT